MKASLMEFRFVLKDNKGILLVQKSILEFAIKDDKRKEKYQ